jgi:phosphoribosyl 1,2-cyclic phosphodiesterase
MRIKFWGIRGSTPTPEGRNSRYGGNTPCIEVRLANDTLIILDCGSGLRGLGKSLLGEFGNRPLQAYIFLTHFHWDHIQGIPFFLPFYKKGNMFFFHSVLREGTDLEETIEGQMTNPYFPVDMSAMGSLRHFYELGEGGIDVQGAVISFAPLNHPQGCVGYRIEANGGVLVLATDTEPGSLVHDRAVRELARGADVLIYDAQYTPEQLAGEKQGWGHSSWLEGVRIARDAGVKRLVLFHHDPDSDDAFVDGLVLKARQQFPNVTGACEGLTIDLSSGDVRDASLGEGADRRTEPRFHVELPVRVGWREANGEQREVRGFSQDISRSGIYFIAPEEIHPDQPLELELVLPDEITQRGDVRIQLVAEPVRQKRANGSAGKPTLGVGIGARLNRPEKV